MKIAKAETAELNYGLSIQPVVDSIRGLELDTDECVVIGSWAWAASLRTAGLWLLRKPNDIDLVVTDESWRRLAEREDLQIGMHPTSGDFFLRNGEVDISTSWPDPNGKHPRSVDELRYGANILGGIAFASCVGAWKEQAGRPKDLLDIDREYIEANLLKAVQLWTDETPQVQPVMLNG